MACASCGTGGCGTKTGNTPNGCKNNGLCKTGGCNRMNSFDWLSNMSLPSSAKFDVVEVKFKGGRKEFYRNPLGLELFTGDPVVVDAENGYHIGNVSLQGELVRLQMLKKKVQDKESLLSIYRIATEKDLEKFEQARNRELTTLYRTREIINEMALKMKLSDVEYQADNTKATFYYSADERVDFRQLIKVLAVEFKIRVEMRQISLRQEAGRLGGIGSCGSELCCSTWLSDFKSVTTAAARYQNLSLNPNKLSGQCGRLKCCLNYELDTYLDALIDIPEIEKPLLTEKGEAHLQKIDIFKKILWFSYKDEETTWHPVSAERVREILALNEKGLQVPALLEVEAKPLKVREDEEYKNPPHNKKGEDYNKGKEYRRDERKEHKFENKLEHKHNRSSVENNNKMQVDNKNKILSHQKETKVQQPSNQTNQQNKRTQQQNSSQRHNQGEKSHNQPVKKQENEKSAEDKNLQKQHHQRTHHEHSNQHLSRREHRHNSSKQDGDNKNVVHQQSVKKEHHPHKFAPRQKVNPEQNTRHQKSNDNQPPKKEENKE
ncbi:MAG: regulatory iron-sulfur-containing complex subunit RicT [Flammeovirgaceae bacterium]